MYILNIASAMRKMSIEFKEFVFENSYKQICKGKNVLQGETVIIYWDIRTRKIHNCLEQNEKNKYLILVIFKKFIIPIWRGEKTQNQQIIENNYPKIKAKTNIVNIILVTIRSSKSSLILPKTIRKAERILEVGSGKSCNTPL